MYTKGHVAVAVMASMLLGPLTGNAATVSKQGGAVLVNEGNGFSPIGSRAELPPGTQIMVQPGGLASIAYASNCTVHVGSGIWMVQASAPCTNGATEIDLTGRMSQDAPGGPGIAPLVIGGAIVAIVGVAVIVTNNNNDKAASP